MEAPPPASLGILLTRGPGTADAARAAALARAGVRRGLRVELFLMTEGVDLLAGADAAALVRDGVRVRVCTRSVTDRAAPVDAEGVDYASQYQLAQSVAGSDRFVSFA